MNKIGIMQGRLTPSLDGRIQSFPRKSWQKEFALASEAGFDCIEWLYDFHDADINPIATDVGIHEIKSLSERYRVGISSLCAHCFIEKPFLGAVGAALAERSDILSWLLQRSRMLNIKRLVVPLEETSNIDDQSLDDAARIFEKVLPIAEDADIEIALEASFPPRQFADFLARLSHPLLKVNYDSGNSAYRGYNVRDEFNAYGSRIGSIHIKDKFYMGNTVALGNGNVDFQALSECIKKISYSGDFILEVARGIAGDEFAWAKQNRIFVLTNIIRAL